MAAEPLVSCILITANRRELTQRAVNLFIAQTYPNKQLIVWDNSDAEAGKSSISYLSWTGAHAIRVYTREHGPSIGMLRNHANAEAKGDIIAHWDSDDYSHPNRIAEQVALLQASKKQCVGYREMLFWAPERFPAKCPQCAFGDILRLADGSWTCRTGGCELTGQPGEAWLYRHPSPKYCLGTSLCYWREVWQQRPFQDLPKNNCATGEDTEWLKGVDSLGVTGLCAMDVLPDGSVTGHVESRYGGAQPRMIATIHGGNTMHYGSVLEESTSWQRVPAWDEYCRGNMAL